MYLNKSTVNYLLRNSPCKFKMNNSHYLTGNNIATFTDIVCVENNLTCITCNIKKFFCNISNQRIF